MRASEVAARERVVWCRVVAMLDPILHAARIASLEAEPCQVHVPAVERELVRALDECEAALSTAVLFESMLAEVEARVASEPVSVKRERELVEVVGHG